MVDAPTDRHRNAWVKSMRKMQADLSLRAKYLRQVIAECIDDPTTDDLLEYEARAWAADHLVEALRAIPTPPVAAWDFPEETR